MRAVDQYREPCADGHWVLEFFHEHVEHWPRQTNLAVTLLSLYERTGELSVLDEAIDIFRLVR